MKIRKARKSDLKEIAEIFRIESSKKPYKQEWNEKTSIEKITSLFARGEIYLAEIYKEIVGFISFTKDEIDIIWINEFWLKQDYQRKGIGRKLLSFVEEKSKKEGFMAIEFMSHHKSNASKFYKKLKYKIKGTYIHMTKKLK